jgi:hypothetical protein
MSLLVWIMVGIALWHFTVFIPDRFWGGIVGAFVFAILGSALFGFIANGVSIPGRSDTEIGQAFVAIPGTLLALGLCYLIGSRTGPEPIPR